MSTKLRTELHSSSKLNVIMNFWRHAQNYETNESTEEKITYNKNLKNAR